MCVGLFFILCECECLKNIRVQCFIEGGAMKFYCIRSILRFEIYWTTQLHCALRHTYVYCNCSIWMLFWFKQITLTDSQITNHSTNVAKAATAIIIIIEIKWECLQMWANGNLALFSHKSTQIKLWREKEREKQEKFVICKWWNICSELRMIRMKGLP